MSGPWLPCTTWTPKLYSNVTAHKGLNRFHSNLHKAIVSGNNFFR